MFQELVVDGRLKYGSNDNSGNRQTEKIRLLWQTCLLVIKQCMSFMSCLFLKLAIHKESLDV